MPVLQVAGELDAVAATELRSALIAACVAPCDRIAVDLSDVSYIESVAIGALIEANATVQATAARIAVICTPSDTAKIIRLSGLAHVVPVFDNTDSAIEFLRKRPPRDAT